MSGRSWILLSAGMLVAMAIQLTLALEANHAFRSASAGFSLGAWACLLIDAVTEGRR